MAGSPGAQGEQGTPGIGAQGVQGAQGNTGPQGPQGVAGVQGAVGAGAQGAPGPQGVQGSQGVPGTGAQGPQGPALFIIASTAPVTTYPQGTAWWDLDNGRTYILYDDGTSKQWVEFIGAPGQTGVQGPAGVQGTQGVQGSVGVQGSTGVQGAQGVTGAQGVQGAQGPVAVPGGVNSQVQFNDSGVFGGDAGLQYNKTTDSLLVGGQLVLGAFDVALQRNSAGLIEINNTTAGTFRDLRTRITYSDNFYAGNGSAAAPSLSFYNFNTTGLYAVNAGLMGVALQGTQYYGFSNTSFTIALANGIAWFDFVNPPDLRLYRESASVLQVSSGALGSYGTLKAFDITATRNLNAAGVYPLGEVRGTDHYAFRQNASGVIFLGNTGTRYVFFDAANFQITGPGIFQGNLGCGPGAVNTFPLDVSTSSGGGRFTVQPSGTNVFMSAVNAANSAYLNIYTMAAGGQGIAPLNDNSQVLGQSTNRWNVVYSVSGTVAASDRRMKKDIHDSTLGLAFIESLRPVSYKWVVGINDARRVQDGVEHVPDHYTIDNVLVTGATRPKYKDVVTPVPGVRQHYGLIAQDVITAVRSAGVADFGGIVSGDKHLLPYNDAGIDPAAHLGLNYQEFIAPLIKAVQELSARVKTLEAQLARSK